MSPGCGHSSLGSSFVVPLLGGAWGDGSTPHRPRLGVPRSGALDECFTGLRALGLGNIDHRRLGRPQLAAICADVAMYCNVEHMTIGATAP